MHEKQAFAGLVAREIDVTSNDKALEHIGQLIDAAADLGSSHGTARAFELLDQIRARELSPPEQAVAHYFSANAWQNKRHEKGNTDVWAWEQPEVQLQILELRKATQHLGFKDLPSVLRCRAFTNLGNQFSFIGRSIEAIEAWDRALSEDAKFGMALGNQGYGLSSYARQLFDRGQTIAMLVAAHDRLTQALSSSAVYDGGDESAIKAFVEHIAEIDRHLKVDAARQMLARQRHGIGKTAGERAYRSWSLKNRLFLSPLNDIGVVAAASYDSLTLPPLRTPIDSGMPWVFGFFNQMKQEFASARFMFYNGLQGEKVHFSDRGVKLAHINDYPSYSLAVEQQRAAFRMAYSILDKVGYFINDYFQLGHDHRRVYFKTVWFENRGAPPRPIHSRFLQTQNWMLRGLFWLSKDLFHDEMKASTDPDSRALDTIRQHLEHKYLQVHETWAFAPMQMTEDLSGHRYSISREDFGLKTLKLLKLARAALIYLSLAIAREESQRNEGEGFIPTMPVSDWDDDWKR